MRHLLWLCFLLLLGCHKKDGTILGKEPRDEARTVALIQGGEAPLQVTVTGELIEKCPTAGCWFRLKDETGVIKVDTKAAGFVVVDVPIGTRVTAGGKVEWNDSEAVIQATGLKY